MSEDINNEVIKKTRRALGKYVKKPVLTEKLLKKPPFRFLHDIVNAVINQTGYLKGLFSEEELKTENVKEKDDKIAFLNKLIEAVKVTTKTDFVVRPSKVVAGLEPTKTNILLQTIAVALDAKIDSSEYVAQIKLGKVEDNLDKKKVKKISSSNDIKGKNIPKTKVKDEPQATKLKKRLGESPRSNKSETPKDSSRAKNKISKTNIKRENKTREEKPDLALEKLEPASLKVTTDDKDGTLSIIANEGGNEVINNKESLNKELIEEDKNSDKKIESPQNSNNLNCLPKLDDNGQETENTVDSKGKTTETVQIENIQAEHLEHKNSTQLSKRPKSARPKSGEKYNLSKSKAETHEEILKTPMEMTVNQPKQRPQTSLRPPSVRPSSARPGAPRLRQDSALPLQETVTMGHINVIVENVDNMDEEETVIIQTTSEVAEEQINSVEVPQENKGQLVEQILEQIQVDDGTKRKIDIDWKEDVLYNNDATSREIGQLRALIQTLTKFANPLGKLMNYLHEDIDAMHAELQTWTNIKNQLLSEINKQKRLSAELNKPLFVHLQQLQEDVKRQEHEIVNVRSNILRNEIRIKELLNI